MDTDQTDKNITKLARAVEKTYGSAWHIIWRNFLAGMMRALGMAFGYVVVLGLLILIAQKLGVFDAIINFWQGLLGQVEGLKGGALPIDPEMLKNLPR